MSWHDAVVVSLATASTMELYGVPTTLKHAVATGEAAQTPRWAKMLYQIIKLETISPLYLASLPKLFLLLSKDRVECEVMMTTLSCLEHHEQLVLVGEKIHEVLDTVLDL